MRSVKFIRKSTDLVEPVTLEQLKDQIRLPVDYIFDDLHLSSLLTSARIQAEEYTQRFFINQNVFILFEDVESVMELILPPDTTVINSVKVDGQTLNTADYTFDADFSTLKIEKSGKKCKVDCDTGKSHSNANRAILMIATDEYENRTAEQTSENMAVKSLLTPLRVNIEV